MEPYIERHHPLIASHIEFSPTAGQPLPSITPRIEFTLERLIYANEGGETSAGAGAGAGLARNGGAGGGSCGGNDDEHGSRGPRGPGRTTKNSSRRTTIPKPSGEPGRPASGGFCIETSLVNDQRWSPEEFKALQEAVRAEARRKLDMTASFRGQSKTAIQGICNEMMGDDRWPVLKTYDDCWPVRSMLKLALKYGSESSRRTNLAKSHQRLQAALKGSSPAPPQRD